MREVRIGSLKAALWPNKTQHGIRYGVTFSRVYEDGEQWKSTDSFGLVDPLLLAKVVDRAHRWIVNRDK